MNPEASLFITELYRKYYHMLYIHAYSMLRKQSAAEVAVQEAFTVACRKSEELMHSENPVGWMKNAVRYEALRMADYRKRTNSLFLSLEALEPGSEPCCWDENDSELVEFCQNIVSKEDLEFFLRIAKDGLDFLAEAKRNGVKVTACYKRFERIRNKLQQGLVKYNKS